MFELIKVDPGLANSVDKEWHTIKPQWQYLPMTTDYYNQTKDEVVRANIRSIDQMYGPIKDGQKFSVPLFNTIQGSMKMFAEIRQDPNSTYNKSFPNTAKLLNYLQSTYIPKDYRVNRLIGNMQTISPTWGLNAPHPDFLYEGGITILYYVNDSDGDTLFFEGSECVNRVHPTKGTAAIYPSSMLHAGSTPTKTDTRVVINMCFGPRY